MLFCLILIAISAVIYIRRDDLNKAECNSTEFSFIIIKLVLFEQNIAQPKEEPSATAFLYF